MKTLAARCGSLVHAMDAEHGRNSALESRVEITADDESRLTAKVRDIYRRQLKVEIDWSDAYGFDVLEIGCTCGHAHPGRLCEHVWAVLLTMDEQGLSGRVPGKNPLSVEPIEGLQPISPPVVDQQTPLPSWREQLSEIAHGNLPEARSIARMASRPGKLRRAYFVINPSQSKNEEGLEIRFYVQETLQSGRLGKLKPATLGKEDLASFQVPEDARGFELLTTLADSGFSQQQSYYYYERRFRSAILQPSLYDLVLPDLCAGGRFGRLVPGPDVVFLQWDAEPWQLRLEVEMHPDGARLIGRLTREEETFEITTLVAVLHGGLLLFGESLGQLADPAVLPWLSVLHRDGAIHLDENELDEALEALWQSPTLPAIDLPEGWRWQQVQVAPKPQIEFQPPGYQVDAMFGKVRFFYGEIEVTSKDPRLQLADRDQWRVLPRDFASERHWLQTLALPRPQFDRMNDVQVNLDDFPTVVERLLEEGWNVVAGDQPLRPAGTLKVQVSSGLDWFELRGGAAFGDVEVAMPDLLRAVRKRQSFIELGDGTRGVLPQEWLEHYRPLAEMAGDDSKLKLSQALLLDSLLAAEPGFEPDAGYTEIRQRLRQYRDLAEAHEPESFVGELRAYQRVGLAWLSFLADIGLGGCLADDMGLGKTVQVLAFLDEHRASQEDHQLSLIVVPRSLLHNWQAEATRFTPQLKMHLHYGTKRQENWPPPAGTHVAITTYATLRRDIHDLRMLLFDYVILDEAQAIKNQDSLTSKSCRLLPACHRLALSGTPIENHVGELFSLFEFLNPGMLGSFAKPFLKQEVTAEDLEWLARALAPLILRRTKQQVLKDLPKKTEQTLFCDLGAKQQKLYDEVRDYYRASLKMKVGAKGLGRSKIHVLEALLRLRQVACHPGLVDDRHINGPSAKLELLLERLEEVVAAGHKALVFSQFTSLLAIVRKKLDDHGHRYAYLDGRLRNRQPVIDRFQNDPDCSLFLISLKAGGTGLNLTAASHVFLLDPWWNPAVEAQAIDRSHRIGQDQAVFAYRLIASGTVEEKILELQAKKRDLADAIIARDDSLIRNLTTEDLELLLS